MVSAPSSPLASSQGRDAACVLQVGSAGPPGISLPLSHRHPGPVPVQSATFVGKEELDEFREPWTLVA